MCGIAGMLKKGLTTDEAESILERMGNTMIHRGPDDSGVWADVKAGIGFSYRRLAIIDLSMEGHQPMISKNGRHLISYNGEIYNFNEIRKDLEEEGLVSGWRGHSDTEVMLEAISAWGIEAAVSRFVGMFAFALWDRSERALHLVRDRLGIKPLYYGRMGKAFLFGSEMSALKVHPDFRGEIDRDVLSLYLKRNSVPSPYSIYKGVKKLPPGAILTIKDSWEVDREEPTPRHYWNPKEIAEEGYRNQFAGDEKEAVDALEEILGIAVKLRMIADVPLGVFLSGGVDSSTVTALMQKNSTRPIKTFTIGFHEAAYNEAVDAKAVAEHLGTEHTELYLDPKDALDVIPRLPMLYDEPFSDSSQIPTFLVSKMAREHVTVCLSGDGGDELFGGYNRHFWAPRLWRRLGWMPAGVRRGLAGLLERPSPVAWDSLSSRLDFIIPKGLKQRNLGDKVQKLTTVMGAEDKYDIYRRLVTHWDESTSVVPNSKELPSITSDKKLWADIDDFSLMMMYLDMVSYLPDDILTKVDRASMGVSLEARVPIIDHRVVEFSSSLPLSMKIKGGRGKWLLRQLLYRYVPKEIIDRPKMGFAVPIDTWLRVELREWGESLLSEKRLMAEGFFSPAPIRKRWEEHLSGRWNWQHHLWDILMFQAWLEVQ
ncbi:MAG: asparagine synthase (glutamine-hydrolyzing) [Deltaproteobacteria bacterium]|uniref:asparagine synthase (glutamine-hydrolyzing) n=1 Tax=Candidatus Zymogenus saltonus TaxID=2844893 RepID=A0A9D8KK27_9DELT|nr:asparagine synthase (glutamine-hydrolyzing) [Candidatus Zymogenus saltonus]